MYRYSIYFFIFLLLQLTYSCQFSQNKKESKEQSLTIEQKVDALQAQIKTAIAPFKIVATLNHHRMAKEVGVYTPPSIASIFSDSKVNSDLLSKHGQLLGLDLPFKLLSYSEADTVKVSIAYTSASFIAKRNGLSKEDLSDYSNTIEEILGSFDKKIISETNLDSVTINYGIIKIHSDFDFNKTVQNLKDIVNVQSDTKWFGDIDYKAEANSLGTELRSTTLLLFGGPAPGGKAMKTTPKIGLDAFCQKLLVYENENGEVWVAFNDIVAFSELYYGIATKPQKMINQRLTATFTQAVKKLKVQNK